MVKDSYSSGRQATGDGGWSDNKPQDHEHMGTRPYKLFGNPETMNMNPLLINNIKASIYFKNLKDLTTFEAVVDEIYESCTYVTPWEAGTHSNIARSGLNSAVRGVGTQGRPCTSFVLLVKLFTLQLTGTQIGLLIKHKDSPYIRAVGFLLIRFCIKPDDLWKWVGKFVLDEEPIVVQKDDPPMTMGKFVRMLLTENDYYGTHLPRIPVKTQQEINDAIAATMAEAAAEGWVEPDFRAVAAADAAAEAAAASADAAAAAHSARATSEASRSDRGGGGGHRDDDHDRRRHGDRDRSHDRDRDRDRERERDRDGDRDRDRDRDRRGGGHDDYKYRDSRDSYDRRDRGRDHDRSRDYDRRSRYGDDDRSERMRKEQREEEYYRERRERDQGHRGRSRSPPSGRRV